MFSRILVAACALGLFTVSLGSASVTCPPPESHAAQTAHGDHANPDANGDGRHHPDAPPDEHHSDAELPSCCAMTDVCVPDVRVHAQDIRGGRGPSHAQDGVGPDVAARPPEPPPPKA